MHERTETRQDRGTKCRLDQKHNLHGSSAGESEQGLGWEHPQQTPFEGSVSRPPVPFGQSIVHVLCCHEMRGCAYDGWPHDRSGLSQ